MAYNDFGAFVRRCGERRTDKEDAPLFDEALAADTGRLPNGMRIYAAIAQAADAPKTGGEMFGLYHGVLGDGAVRVGCRREGIPQIWETVDGVPRMVEFYDADADRYEYEPFEFERGGYKFHFASGLTRAKKRESDSALFLAEMIEPDGTAWQCVYGCQYGAGFEALGG